MKIGVFINTQFHPNVPLGPKINDLLDQVVTARESGIYSIWFGQHLVTGPLQMFQITPLLARIIPETKGMKIGSSVALLSIQNPIQFSEEMATLDWLSDGNIICGAGIGYRPQEFEAAGIPMKIRGKRFEEALKIVRQCWFEEEVNFVGEYFNIKHQIPSIKPKQKNGPPIWIAGEANIAIRRAALMGDAWLPLPVPNRDALCKDLKFYRNERSQVGRTAAKEQPLMREVYIGKNFDSAFDECQYALNNKYESYSKWGQSESAESRDDFNRDFRNFATNRFIIGDKLSVLDEIQQYRDELNIDHLICRVEWPGLENDKVIQTIKLLGECAKLL